MPLKPSQIGYNQGQLQGKLPQGPPAGSVSEIMRRSSPSQQSQKGRDLMNSGLNRVASSGNSGFDKPGGGYGAMLGQNGGQYSSLNNIPTSMGSVSKVKPQESAPVSRHGMIQEYQSAPNPTPSVMQARQNIIA